MNSNPSSMPLKRRLICRFSFKNFEQIKEGMEKPQKENIEDEQRTSATQVRK
jgi:hypothetical protein